jgi:DNA primase
MADDVVLVEAGGREIPITNPGKVYFNERGETKLDLVHYYQTVEEPLLRAMRGRPVLLQRFPNGASGPSFFQKRVPTGSRPPSSARPTGRRRAPWWQLTSPMSCGR